jgi:HEPN superfamily AbiU2-like protein
MSGIPFEKIRDAVVEEIIGVTNTYVLMTDFAFPVGSQSRLSEHYPFFVGTLVEAFRGHVLIAICRLFDPDDDPRHASLANFLRRVAAHHVSDKEVAPGAVAGREDYERQIPEYFADIRTRWKPLVIHRSAYLAHRDLSKTPPDMTYQFLHERIANISTVRRRSPPSWPPSL